MCIVPGLIRGAELLHVFAVSTELAAPREVFRHLVSTYSRSTGMSDVTAEKRHDLQDAQQRACLPATSILTSEFCVSCHSTE